MILKSEAECIEALGAAGKRAWSDGIKRLSFLGVDYDIERPPVKLEPLSVKEAIAIFNQGGEDRSDEEQIVAVIRAHDERNAQISASETDEELECWVAMRRHLQAKFIIAAIRAHDRAKATKCEKCAWYQRDAERRCERLEDPPEGCDCSGCELAALDRLDPERGT